MLNFISQHEILFEKCLAAKNWQPTVQREIRTIYVYKFTNVHIKNVNATLQWFGSELCLKVYVGKPVSL